MSALAVTALRCLSRPRSRLRLCPRLRSFHLQSCPAMSERHFEDSSHAQVYSLYRPAPPKSLVDAVVKFLDEKGCYESLHELALDVGCGSGQGTVGLAPHFKRVIGTDISRSQLDEAKTALAKGPDSPKNVEYREAREKGWDFVGDASVGLVLTCQAIHWFDIPAFYREVDRVLRPGGVLVVAGYDFTDPAPSVKNYEKLAKLRAKVYFEDTKGHWSDLREQVDNRYTTIPQIPYSGALRDESHFVDTESTLEGLKGYLQTWSGFQSFRRTEGEAAANSVLARFESECKKALEVPDSTDPNKIPMTLRTTYFMLLGRKPE